MVQIQLLQVVVEAGLRVVVLVVDLVEPVEQVVVEQVEHPQEVEKEQQDQLIPAAVAVVEETYLTQRQQDEVEMVVQVS